MRSNVTLRGDAVAWDSPEGRALIKILLPSTNLINFRIAHEIAHLKRHDPFREVPLSPIFLVGGYHLAVFLCKTPIFSAKVVLAFPLFFFMALFAYAEVSSLLNQQLEYQADRMAAMASKKYAEGGIELMRKQMELDALTRYGSNSSSFLQKILSNFSSHPPYDERLQKLEKVLVLHSSLGD